jgi:HEAT repeat protein
VKALILLAVALPAFAGDLERFLDVKLDYTPRNAACLALRGNRDPEVILIMRASLADMNLQQCAATNLRVAGASGELLNALSDHEPTVRAAGARELGSMQRPEFLAPLREAVNDKDLLVASNAIEGLVRYENHSSAPQLREVALMGGVMTSLALDTLVDWHDPEVAAIGRKLMDRPDPGDKLAGIRAIGLTGDNSDLPKLRELAKDSENLAAGSRGFGLMPAISISKAAGTAVQNLQDRNQQDRRTSAMREKESLPAR